MKKLNYVFLLSFMLMLIAGCSKTDDFLLNEPLGNTLKKGHAEPVTVTVPFKADFTVLDHSDYTDESCGGYPVFALTMIGEGNINHMGKITTEMTFCCDVSNGSYFDTNCTFVAANGDELYAVVPTGQILPNEGDNSDYYETYFNDKMYFTGGTGRFEGASGEAMTNAFVHNNPEDWHTDFFSTGELILVKGKR